jgi:hypothetical protein
MIVEAEIKIFRIMEINISESSSGKNSLLSHSEIRTVTGGPASN